jgi:hypothetical protein
MADEFITIFRNKRDGLVVVDDYNGEVTRLAPGEAWELKSLSPRTLFSRFAEVVYRNGGVVDIKGNPLWRNPYEKFWCIELANLEGARSESIQLLAPREAGEVAGLSANDYIEAFRGFPRIVPVSINCKLVRFSRIEWVRVTEKVPVEGAPGYWEMKTEVKMIKIERSPADLRKIAKELEQVALDRAKAEASTIRNSIEQAK